LEVVAGGDRIGQRQATEVTGNKGSTRVAGSNLAMERGCASGSLVVSAGVVVAVLARQ